MTSEEKALIYFKDLRARKVKDYSSVFDTAPKDSVVYEAVSAEIEIYDTTIKALEQTRWIPCSEKMPDVNIHVLAQFVMGGMAECYFAHNWWHIVGGFRISGDEVIAWMPLPPYYEPQESEDKE